MALHSTSVPGAAKVGQHTACTGVTARVNIVVCALLSLQAHKAQRKGAKMQCTLTARVAVLQCLQRAAAHNDPADPRSTHNQLALHHRPSHRPPHKPAHGLVFSRYNPEDLMLSIAGGPAPWSLVLQSLYPLQYNPHDQLPCCGDSLTAAILQGPRHCREAHPKPSGCGASKIPHASETLLVHWARSMIQASLLKSGTPFAASGPSPHASRLQGNLGTVRVYI